MNEWVGVWRLAFARPRGLRPLRWTAVFRDHELHVVTRGPLRARLYVAGACVDERSPLVSTRRAIPLLSTRLESPDDDVWIAEVYVKGRLARDVKIYVNGKPIPALLSPDDTCDRMGS